MENKWIKIKNAKENNLKNISVDIPKEKLVIITGVSGSGKSSLAFDVLYNEGRRRYINSLSNYARQFLGGVKKPDVESIEGLSPAIAINQKTTSNNPRSIVGTMTEIYDYYRLLFAKIGEPYCPNHNIKISTRTITEVVDQILAENKNQKIKILSPVISAQKGTHHDLLEQLKKDNFFRIQVNKEEHTLDEVIVLDKNKKHTISIVVDRIVSDKEHRSRLFESIQVASDYSGGNVNVYNTETKVKELFSLNLSCKHGDFSLEKIEPRLFSFNSPIGACPECKGLGNSQKVDWAKMINPGKTIIGDGIKFYTSKSAIAWSKLQALLEYYQIDPTKKVETLNKREIDIIMNGSDVPIKHTYPLKGMLVEVFEPIEGVGVQMKRRMLKTSSELARDFYSTFLYESKCTMCNGDRLKKPALFVKIKDTNIMELTKMSITDAYDWFIKLNLNKKEADISNLILEEITSRFEFLINVGLGYLSLDRESKTLSGGENQRIRLASQLGSKLTGIIYVLDEPSIGLHQRDNDKLINTLKRIRDIGNTVVVVEHDEDTMLASDYIIDIGPKSGKQGGQVVFSGTPKEIMKSDSLTGRFLSKQEVIQPPDELRKGNGKELVIIGAKENNLKNIDVTIPLGKMVAITGVSGSGKSTLLNEIIYKTLHNKTKKVGEDLIPGKHDDLKGYEHIDKIIRITQQPIGKTPRSNPATYTGAFDDIRELFSNTKEARIKGFNKGRFSFNVKGGRCDKCQGDGVITIEMHFLPDVYVTCDQCNGKRYNEETLLIKYKDKTISDILNMDVNQAYDLFQNVPKLKNKLGLLKDVGLDYITLGHKSTNLSGGESQRVKIATYLQKPSTGKTLYLLDEPTTGLHTSDIKQLMKVLNKMMENNDSMIIIEHNLDVIKSVDYIIDMGPEGGKNGGQIIAKGTPKQISTSQSSITGKYLKF